MKRVRNSEKSFISTEPTFEIHCIQKHKYGIFGEESFSQDVLYHFVCLLRNPRIDFLLDFSSPPGEVGSLHFGVVVFLKTPKL